MIMGVGPFSLARGLLHLFCFIELIVNMIFFCYSFLSVLGYIDATCLKNGIEDPQYDNIYLLIAFLAFVGVFGNIFYFDLIECGAPKHISDEKVRQVVIVNIYVHWVINIIQILALFTFSGYGNVCSEDTRYFFMIGAVLYSFITMVWVWCFGGILFKLIEYHYGSKENNIT